MSWTTRPLLGFDTETTGVDVANDRIVTVALVRRVPGVSTEIRTWLIDPGVPIPAEAAAIHGITTDQAAAFGAPPLLALEEVAGLIAADLTAGVPVVAFNAAFDLSLLDAELARHGLPTLPERVGKAVFPIIDPLVLDRALDRYRRGKRTLGDLAAFYEVFGSGKLHTAEVDVVATLDVLDALAQTYPEIAHLDLEELYRFQVTAHRDWSENFNSWRAARGYVGASVPSGWPY